jgi:hypothetical protein
VARNPAGPRQRPRLAALSSSQTKAPGFAGGYLLVNPDSSDEFKQRLSSLFRKEHFEQGIIVSVPHTVRRFFEGEDCRQLIGRTFKAGSWRMS